MSTVKRPPPLRIVGLVWIALAAGVIRAEPGSKDEDEDITVFRYACAGGKFITAVWDRSDPDDAKTFVTVEGDPALQNIEMRQGFAASGVRNTNDKLTWWTRGDEGFLAEEHPPEGSDGMLVDDCVDVGTLR